MGCCLSTPAPNDAGIERVVPSKEARRGRRLRKPVWKSDAPLTEAKLQAMREEFWDTQPHYGGAQEIWDALKAAAGSDLATAQLICDSAGVIVASSDLTTCYDERGRAVSALFHDFT
eukprot:jgi/Botrbrau1/10552/Bobra.0343s0001.1